MTETTVHVEPRTDVLESLDPRTGEVIATFPIHSDQEVRDIVVRAREAAKWWDELGFSGRAKRIDAWRKHMVAHLDELIALVSRETGKSLDDATLECALFIDHVHWAAANAKKVLGKKKRPSGLLMSNFRATVEYRPWGVVGAIGPWNYPVYTPGGMFVYAIAAGNAVVFKPSEYTPAVGRWLVDSFHEVVPEQPVFSLITGFGATGAALATSGVDKLAFTGSAATGKLVAKAAAETLTPVTMECGGKDAVIVAADADLDAAAEQIVFGAIANSGQTCAGIERAYVVDSVADRLLELVVEKTKKITAGPGANDTIGPMCMPKQIPIVRRHIEAALADGGKALVGGLDSVKDPYIEPVILVDVPETSAAVQEETFGPVVIINRVADLDEAIRKSNDTGYGLGAAVFSKSLGEKIADRLNVGMVSINSFLTFAAIPTLPFGGRGLSGYGRMHGEEGLRDFSAPRAVTKKLFPGVIDPLGYGRKENAVKNLLTVIKARYGKF
ncbi:aldehyde dehydrogenase family protein [Pseudonocardiaceae bacterium YIM PH 21723]|nr:aldehyde dehydrogenase family protein [Pseudonocardiaceae bacterium YIM PH 21723]